MATHFRQGVDESAYAPPIGENGKPEPEQRPKRRHRVAVIVVFNVILFLSIYLGSVYLRAGRLQDRLRGKSTGLHRPDPVLGYALRPGAESFGLISNSPAIRVLIDDQGFRVSANATGAHRNSRPRILFLGDSFTFGAGVSGEETFAERTAALLDGQAMNAGTSGWGLGQMLRQSQSLLSTASCDAVVVQYSDWLPSRSMTRFRQAVGAPTPNPYFFDGPEGPALHDPVFMFVQGALPVEMYVNAGRWFFFWHVSVPLYAYTDYTVVRLAILNLLHRLPPPTKSREAVVSATYRGIADACAAQHIPMFILPLPSRLGERPADKITSFSARVVDVHDKLAAALPAATQAEWERSYYIWGGSPPVIVDRHPSPLMHARIAEILAGAIRDSISIATNSVQANQTTR